MIIWMSGVTDIGSTPPPSAATVGRRPSKTPKMQIAATAGQEDRDAALRVGHQHDLTGGCRRLDLAGGEAALVLDVVVEVLAVAVHEERHHEDADDAGRDRDQHDVDDVEAVDLDERAASSPSRRRPGSQ